MFKKYRIGFNLWGLVLLTSIMIPNFIWFALPASNDILRTESVTAALDTIASVCQVIMITAQCMVINRNCKKISLTPFVIAMLIFCLFYFGACASYYKGITNSLVILDMYIAPCLAFLFFLLTEKYDCCSTADYFSICHLIYGIINFIV